MTRQFHLYNNTRFDIGEFLIYHFGTGDHRILHWHKFLSRKFSTNSIHSGNLTRDYVRLTTGIISFKLVRVFLSLSLTDPDTFVCLLCGSDVILFPVPPVGVRFLSPVSSLFCTVMELEHEDRRSWHCFV